MSGMKNTLTIDAAGRLVIPKEVRRQLKLDPGSKVRLEVGEDHVTLRPVQEAPVMVKRHGWWVHLGKLDSDVTDFVQRDREERLDDLSR